MKPSEFIEKTIMMTIRKGYVQIFGDHEFCGYMDSYNRDNCILFVKYFCKKNKIKFDKHDMDKTYEQFLDND